MLHDNDLTWKIVGGIALITIMATVGMAFDLGKDLLSLPEPKKIDVPAAARKAPSTYAAESPSPLPLPTVEVSPLPEGSLLPVSP